MRRAIAIVCVIMTGLLLMGAAPSIKSYQEIFRMEADGAGKVAARVELAELKPGTWEVPLTTWKGVKEVKWSGVPDDVKVQPALSGQAPCLRVTVGQEAAAGFVMDLDYQVPAPKAAPKPKNQPPRETTLSFRFLNGGQLPVADYDLKVLLPEGNMVHSVQEKTPKGKGLAGAQVAYIRDDGRLGFTLAAENLKFGDAAGIKLTMVEERKSPVVLVILGLVAVAYMIVFRDIVKPSA